MIRPIMKDPIFLAQKSVPATVTDLPIVQDLRDTLEAHQDGCVGMAANMIGAANRNRLSRKQIIPCYVLLKRKT